VLERAEGLGNGGVEVVGGADVDRARPGKRALGGYLVGSARQTDLRSARLQLLAGIKKPAMPPGPANVPTRPGEQGEVLFVGYAERARRNAAKSSAPAPSIRALPGSGAEESETDTSSTDRLKVWPAAFHSSNSIR
jgi:hypothetical protein